MIELYAPDLDIITRVLNAEKIHAAELRGMNKAMKYLHSKVPSYPSPRPGQTYRRTGTLGRRNTTEVRQEGNDILGVLGNNTEYAPYVIGRETQAWMHVDRWYTLEGVGEGAAPAMQGIIGDEIDKAFNSGSK